jgi:2-C-methyl-D-erythritol 4-phosphate cytidylyltransferase
VILAAGRGVRLGGEGPSKALLDLAGAPMLVHAIRPFAAHAAIDEVMLVAAAEDIRTCTRELDRAGLGDVTVIAGGPTRHASEWLAVQRLAPRIEDGDIDSVLIHDAARPLYRGEHLVDLLAAGRESGGAIFAIPFDPEEEVVQLRDGRSPAAAASEGMWRAQTPQAFQAGRLLEAFRRAEAEGFEGSDTSSTVERIGVPVRVLPGDPRNIKITYPQDLVLAESLLEGEAGPG